MLGYIANRTAQGLLLLLLVSFISFAVMLLAPGNAMQTFINPRMSPEEKLKHNEATRIDWDKQ